MITPEMIHPEYIADKLNYQASLFREMMIEKQYAAAKHCYDTVVTLTTFLELPESERIELFGNRPYADEGDKIVDGLFREELVQKAYEECAVRRNLGRENQPYKRPFAK